MEHSLFPEGQVAVGLGDGIRGDFGEVAQVALQTLTEIQWSSSVLAIGTSFLDIEAKTMSMPLLVEMKYTSTKL